MVYDLAVVGGGAAGFFGAIQTAENFPNAKIIILEKANKVLSKVKISGGGRCNVTHACFEPREMIENYPRGKRELRGPFSQFLCGDMIAWLSDNGVETKIENDGRVFPVSDSSQSIIDCFKEKCKKHKIEIQMGEGLKDFQKSDEFFDLNCSQNNYRAKQVLFTTGSSPSMWKMLASKGHKIESPVPSLFTFNIKNPVIKELMGLSVPNALVKLKLQKGAGKFSSSGPLLITHWGISGPAVLKLSAWAARELHACNYEYEVSVSWIDKEVHEVREMIQFLRKNAGSKNLRNNNIFMLPKRLWERILKLGDIEMKNFADLNSKEIESLINMVGDCKMAVKGKSTFKEEFVTCGGVQLNEVNFKTMESKVVPGLFFAGEVLNIDAITGGFNFQAAWTESFIAGKEIANRIGEEN